MDEGFVAVVGAAEAPAVAQPIPADARYGVVEAFLSTMHHLDEGRRGLAEVPAAMLVRAVTHSLGGFEGRAVCQISAAV